MKTLLLICGLFTLCTPGFGQILTLYNGFSNTGLRIKNLPLFPKDIYSYSGLIGLEYSPHRWFDLSSQAGYIKIGGKYNSLAGVDSTESWNYAHFNTTFRLRGSNSKSEVYLGAGPYVNVMLSNKVFQNHLYDGWELKRMNAGAKIEIGILEKFNRFRVGFNGSWLIPITPLAKSPYTSMKYKDLSAYVSLGYQLH